MALAVNLLEDLSVALVMPKPLDKAQLILKGNSFTGNIKLKGQLYRRYDRRSGVHVSGTEAGQQLWS